jgi:hypothetical protein
MRRAFLLLALLVGCDQEFDVHAFEADLEIAPDVTDLGAVGVGASVDFVLQATHIEGPDVTIEAVEVENLSGETFSFVGELPVVLTTDQTATLAMHYLPTEIGYHWAEVTVVSDAHEERITVMVRGQAAEAEGSIFPPLLDFGPVAANATGQAELWVSNDASVPFSVSGVTLEPGLFSVLSSLPLEVPGGQQVVVQLAYSARDEEPIEGSAVVQVDAEEVTLPTVTLMANDCERGDATLYDQDGDGYGQCGTDCDDTDPTVNPSGVEICDDIDQDCDGIIDEGTECYDDDGDEYTELDGDCNDGDPAVNPGATEDYANGIDDDCDGTVDSDLQDFDGDGYAYEGGDCDDSDPGANPGEVETYDGVDNDCDGAVDEDTEWSDDDLDGQSELDGDCDDDDDTTYLGAPEQADWTDNDCDGRVDEGTVNSDDDGDGYTEVGGDCDDGTAAINPSVLEIVGDGVDNDCDGVAQ